MKWVNSTIAWYLRHRMRRIEYFMERPEIAQENIFKQLLLSAKRTSFGKEHGFDSIKSPSDFAARVPIQEYDEIKPYIHRMMMGESNVLWPGKVKWFSKSSGTTSDKSKYIPVSLQNLKGCHIRGGWDTMTMYHANNRQSQIFNGKTLLMGGTYDSFPSHPATKIGDVSALMIQNMPAIAKVFSTPGTDVAFIPDWEEKIAKMAAMLQHENMSHIGGVPTWTIVLFREILELTGKEHIKEVWPNLELYIHGGVSFTPYKEQFKSYIPDDDFTYVEIYNASEGYFAAQSEIGADDMLLLLDNGVYYEFLPMEEWGKDHPKAIPLYEVEEGKVYAMVISTNAGLWRYLIGDTVKFTSTSPYKIKIVGRIKHFINAFGEEVMVENTDKALAMTCAGLNATVKEYTVAPIFIKGKEKGAHEWLVEFERMPENIAQFQSLLDLNLQKVNSDYEAKRYKSMALRELSLRVLPAGSFYKWMKSKGKYGGQHKVPRLANTRQYIDEILSLAEVK